ncbi:MAG: caspase family protein [Vicingaceae bacterium]
MITSFCFAQGQFEYSKGVRFEKYIGSENDIKRYLDNNHIDPIEGIWSLSFRGVIEDHEFERENYFRIAIIKDPTTNSRDYMEIFISCADEGTIEILGLKPFYLMGKIDKTSNPKVYLADAYKTTMEIEGIPTSANYILDENGLLHYSFSYYLNGSKIEENNYGIKRYPTFNSIQSTKTPESEKYTDPTDLNSLTLTSDVDSDIPTSGITYKNKYALVIGNEDYKRHQKNLQYDQNVEFAINDAVIVKEYLVKTLGYQENHVFISINATLGSMNREIDRLVKLASLDPEAEVLFYYAGHGLPDINTRQAFLMPVDVTAGSMQDGIGLNELFAKLASSKAKKTIVILDACFSGGGRGENGLLAARAVKIKPKGETISGNLLVFTASSGEEVSSPLNSESHGLFTYYFLKKLKETKGNVSAGQLKQYLELEVARTSLIENERQQTPQILVSPTLGNSWSSWKL